MASQAHVIHTGASLINEWERELSEGCLADVTFHISQSGKSFKLSRLPFALASPVFKAMFMQSHDHQWLEQQSSFVEIEDVTAEAFEQMARYAYRVGEDLTPCNVVQVMKASDKYQMLSLKQACDIKIEEILQSGNGNDSLRLLDAMVQEKMELGTIFEEFLGTVDDHFLRCEAFVQVSQQTLQIFLGYQLPLCEDDIWNACCAWARHTAEAKGGSWQDVLRPLCGMINFVNISQDLLDMHVIRSGVLSSEEEVGILLHQRGSVLIQNLPEFRKNFNFMSFDMKSLAPDTTLEKEGSVVKFGRETQHRCVFGKQGWSHGMHSWTITWLKTGCCAYAGIASAKQISRGSQNEGKDKRMLEPFVVFGKKDVSDGVVMIIEKREGARLAITLLLDSGKILLQADDGRKVERALSHSGVLHPALDSDENNVFQIQPGIHLK